MQVGDKWKDDGMGIGLAMTLSPDGKTVATGGGDGAVRLWNIDTGKVIKKWTGPHLVRSLCWSPDGASWRASGEWILGWSIQNMGCQEGRNQRQDDCHQRAGICENLGCQHRRIAQNN